MAPPKLTPGNSRGSSVASDNDNTSEVDVSLNVKGIVGGPSSATASSSSLPTEQYYTIPSWLAGNEKHTAYKFSLDFPKVNGTTRKAIEQYVRQNSSSFLKESTQASHQLHELQREESEAQRQVALAQEKLNNALVSKEDDLKKLRKEKQKAHAKKLHELERQMRQQHMKEWKKTEARMEEEARADFEKSYEEEQQRKKNNKKRQREEEEEQQEEKEGQAKKQGESSSQAEDDDEEEGVIKEDDERSSSQQQEQPVPKKQKTTADVDTTTTTTMSGVEGSGSASVGGDKSSQKEEPSPESAALRVEIVGLEQKRDKVQTELDRLNERKKEIAWLLKQTIKGEMKQKKALLLSQRNKAKVEDSK
mmetsp:Transcript_22330/g.52607  ORF Transcript_22330/g.52607 Transcript_22330/m.52607 type:complete len:363 (+) Transcript_22330:66-1154(+)